LAQWLKAAPKSQDLSRSSKDLLVVGQKVEKEYYAPIFLNFYDSNSALRCRALAAFALVCLFSSSSDVSFADAIISTPLLDTLLHSAAATITPILLDDNANKLPFECTCKIVQHLSLCCMVMLSTHHCIASSWSNNSEFSSLVLHLLSDGQPDCKPHVISLLFLVSRSCPNFIQSLFEDASKIGPHAVGSVVRSILDFLAEYSQRYLSFVVVLFCHRNAWSSFRIDLADEDIPNAAQRDAEYDEFDSEPVSQQNFRDWQSFLCLARQKGIM